MADVFVSYSRSDKARVAPFYDGLKRDIAWLLNKVPVVGESAEHMLGQFKDAVKTFLHGTFITENPSVQWKVPIGVVVLFALRGIGDYVQGYFPSWVGRRR